MSDEGRKVANAYEKWPPFTRGGRGNCEGFTVSIIGLVVGTSLLLGEKMIFFRAVEMYETPLSALHSIGVKILSVGGVGTPWNRMEQSGTKRQV